MADVPNLDLDAAKSSADGTAQFAEVIEQMAAQDKLAAEAAERRKQAARELRDLYGDFATSIDKAAKRNKDLMDSMRDGTLARTTREMDRLNRQYANLRREADLAHRYGDRVGGFLARNDRLLSGAGRVGGIAAGAALATGTGLVRQGFSGTVEGERLARETKLLARELAGAFKPVIDITTRMVRGLREFMEGLSPTGQNLVALAGTALAASTALKLLGLGGAGGFARAGAQTLLTGGLSIGVQAAASAGGSAVGSAAGSAAGGAAGSAARGAAGGAATAGTVLRGAGRVARAVPYLGLAFTAGDVAVGGDYGRFRAAGKSRFASGAMSFGASLYDSYHFLAPWESGPNPLDAARKRWDEKHGLTDGHRTVTPAGGGWDAPGTGYERLNTAISLVEPERTPPDELGRRLEEIRDILARHEEIMKRRESPPLRRPGDS